jgi:hypothetical protein
MPPTQPDAPAIHIDLRGGGQEPHIDVRHSPHKLGRVAARAAMGCHGLQRQGLLLEVAVGKNAKMLELRDSHRQKLVEASEDP